MTFEEYVRARGPALLRFAQLVAGDPHRGEDLTQDVLARAYARWHRIGRLDRPDLYLRRMIVNTNASWWRRGRRELPGDGPAVDTPVPGPDIGERDALWQQLRQLPRNQRIALVLRFYEDHDDTTIAEVLGCSPNTVRTHVMRALAALRSRLTATDARSTP